jgi:hypothetical protein
MALSLSTSVKDRVAMRIFSARTYAALGAGYQQDLIDNEGAMALTLFETLAQWFTLTTASGNAPDEWMPAFVDEIVARIEQNAHPERAAQAERQAKRSLQAAIDSYARATMTYDPGSTTEAFVYHVLNNRKYVLSHVLRLNPRLFPDPVTVDAALEETATFMFNKAGWAFRRRPVNIVITRTEFTGGSWTESSKTITGLTGVGTSLPTGTRFYATDGTSVKLREFSIVSSTSTTIVLADSLSTTAGNLTAADIEGFYYVVTVEGLESGESFDSLASYCLRYTDADSGGLALTWLNADDFAEVRAADGVSGVEDGQPLYFRTFQPSGTVTGWLFSPPPDDDYVLRGEVFTLTPTDPASSTATTMFAKFAAEFMPTMRRMQLDRVLTNYGRTNQQLHSEVTDEIETLFPEYQDPGKADGRTRTTDVYGDYGELGVGNGGGL